MMWVRGWNILGKDWKHTKVSFILIIDQTSKKLYKLITKMSSTMNIVRILKKAVII
jgi:hypothetical protein